MRAITKKPTDMKRMVRGPKESKLSQIHVCLHFADLDKNFLIPVAYDCSVAAWQPLDPVTVNSSSVDWGFWCLDSWKPCIPCHRDEWYCSRPPLQTWKSPIFSVKSNRWHVSPSHGDIFWRCSTPGCWSLSWDPSLTL